jgi:hypothetical protein
MLENVFVITSVFQLKEWSGPVIYEKIMKETICTFFWLFRFLFAFIKNVQLIYHRPSEKVAD